MLQHMLHGDDVEALAGLDHPVQRLEGIAETGRAQQLRMEAPQAVIGEVEPARRIAGAGGGGQQPALAAADLEQPPAARAARRLRRVQQQPGHEVAVGAFGGVVVRRVSAVRALEIFAGVERLQRLGARLRLNRAPSVRMSRQIVGRGHHQRVSVIRGTPR